MPGYGAERQELRERASTKRLKTMTIRMPSHEDPRAGHVVEHAYHEHKPELWKFGADQTAELAAHLSKHLGVKLPGKAAGGESAEPEVSKSDFE